jgi:hypothetical protein
MTDMIICPKNFCLEVNPKFRFKTTLIKSSKNPKRPNPNVTNKSKKAFTGVWSAYFPIMTKVVIMIENKIITPPIVGVPDFFWWDLGPSSRILCPNFNLRKKGIKMGESKTEIKKPIIIVKKITCSFILSPPILIIL